MTHSLEHLTLIEFPRTIADRQQELLHLEQQLRDQRETVTFCLNAIDRIIARDDSLKNDNQRKARRSELLETDPDTIQASRQLKRLEDLKAELDLDLQLLLNLFTVRKLEERRAIASLELQTRL